MLNIPLYREQAHVIGPEFFFNEPNVPNTGTPTENQIRTSCLIGAHAHYYTNEACERKIFVFKYQNNNNINNNNNNNNNNNIITLINIIFLHQNNLLNYHLRPHTKEVNGGIDAEHSKTT